jgi:hypothetical protein
MFIVCMVKPMVILNVACTFPIYHLFWMSSQQIQWCLGCDQTLQSTPYTPHHNHLDCSNPTMHCEKKWCFTTSLAIQFCDCIRHLHISLYLYIVSANGQVAWIVKLPFIVNTMELIATQLQFCQNNSFKTITQLRYNCTHHAMLTLLIVIHPLKSNMWHYEDFWT